jgi:hypothetical protein
VDKYGPFVNIVAVASFLVATFSVLLLKMLGKTTQWTWLASESTPFLVTAGPRILAVAFMAITYVTINQSNYLWFAVVAVLIGFFGFWAVIRFDQLRQRHVLAIPLVSEDGQPLRSRNNNPRVKNIVIGLEPQLRSEAKEALRNARQQRGGLSLAQFMAGYGAQNLNDPEALWLKEVLADISNKLSLMLMFIVLSAVMAIFLAAFVIEVGG